MNRQSISAITLTCAAFISILVFLLAILGAGWRGITWFLLVAGALSMVGAFAPVVYAIVSMEIGYYTRDAISGGAQRQVARESHSLKALLHMRRLGHR